MTTELSPCILWGGSISRDGYGRWGDGMAHRRLYEIERGKIPDGLELDHICHTFDLNCNDGSLCLHRACVNLEHLELVTHRVNVLRGRSPAAAHAAATHCPSGHEYNDKNTYLYRGARQTERKCRLCNLAAVKRRRDRNDR